jgi:hypothetical protein
MHGQRNVKKKMDVSGQLYDLVTVPSEKDPQYPLNMSLSGPHRRFGRFGVEEKSEICTLLGYYAA